LFEEQDVKRVKGSGGTTLEGKKKQEKSVFGSVCVPKCTKEDRGRGGKKQGEKEKSWGTPGANCVPGRAMGSLEE